MNMENDNINKSLECLEMSWNDLNIAKLRCWYIIFNLHSSVSLEMSTWEQLRVGTWHTSAPVQPTLTLLSALILSPALLLTGLDGLTGRHGCCEMWWQWALRSVFIDILDGRLYFPYNLFKTKKNAQNLFNLSSGRIGTSANFADRLCLVKRESWQMQVHFWACLRNLLISVVHEAQVLFS